MAIEENKIVNENALAPEVESTQPQMPTHNTPNEEVANIRELQSISTQALLDDSHDLWGGIYGNKEIKVKNYNQPFIMTIIGILLLGAIAAASFFFLWYLNTESTPNRGAKIDDYSQATSKYYDEYGEMLGLFDLRGYQNMDLKESGTGKITNLMTDHSLNYIQKENLLQSAATTLGSQIIQLKEETQNFNDQLNKDGFFPEELVEILKKDNTVGSIQRSLLSLEVVKFSSAMKVFSLMEVFLASISDELRISKFEAKERFDELIARGEKDVKNYLSFCYNNPYEPSKCNIINDFDTYYKLNPNEANFDTSYFKGLMELVDNKLEYSNMPSFSITFNSFDGGSNSIAFTVEVNTLREDEYALIKQGVKSPHIFIVSELIKLLKQSTFILGKAIDAKDVQVQAKKIKIWWNEYMVNNSTKTFSLPIQTQTEREIFDYLESYQASIQTAEEETGVLAPSIENIGENPAGFIPISNEGQETANSATGTQATTSALETNEVSPSNWR